MSDTARWLTSAAGAALPIAASVVPSTAATKYLRPLRPLAATVESLIFHSPRLDFGTLFHYKDDIDPISRFFEPFTMLTTILRKPRKIGRGLALWHFRSPHGIKSLCYMKIYN